MAGSSVSSSQNTAQNQSQSQSTTGVLDYPERAFLDSIAQYAGTAGQDVYNWAQQAYAKNTALTDANINNYLSTSQQALTNAGKYQNAYDTNAIPGIESQYEAARNYASPGRQQRDMAAAESGQMQGNEAALNNHKRDLQAYGIDPSSGRYAGLDEAARVQGAAAAVGSAQQAQRADEDRGQTMLNTAIQNSQPWMGAAVNERNTALQGYAGAENAGLANANTGVQLQQAANPFLQTASSYKPITGTNSTASSSGSSQGTSGSSSSTSDPSSSSKSPTDQNKQGTDGGGNNSAVTPGMGTSIGGGSGSGGSGGDSNNDGIYDGGLNDGYGDSTVTDNDGSSDGSNFTYDYGNTGYEPTDFTDSGGSGSADMSFDYGSGQTYGFDSSGNMDSGGGGDSGGSVDYGGYGDYAQGGTIEEPGAIPEDGGPIPMSASPSRGQVTDDVRAQLPSGKPINVNAGEFVVPEDIVRFKGEEFFQKLIAQARKARVTAPAQPSHGMQRHA